MKKNIMNGLSAVILIFLLNGCATMFTGPKQDIRITSVPDSADVRIERLTGSQSIKYWEGKTPSTVTFNRNESYVVTISKDNFERSEIPVGYGGINGWTWCNILLGGLIGIVIDAYSGAIYTLSPEEVSANLELLPPRRPG